MHAVAYNIFNTLKDIIQEVNDASGLVEALNITVGRTRQVLQADAVSVYFRDEATDQLVLMATDGLNQHAVGSIRFKLDEGLIGLIASQAELINLKDAPSHSKYRYVMETNEVTFHGFLGVPIIQHRHVLGVLVVRQITARRFSSNSETFLMTLAAQLAGAISHAERVGEVTHLLENKPNESFFMKGLNGAPGIGIGEAYVVFPAANLEAVPDQAIEPGEIEFHINAFHKAVESVKLEFVELAHKMKDALSSEELALFDVFLLMLKSDTLIDAIVNKIKAGQWAQGALRQTIGDHVKQFSAMEDPYFRERAVDIKDLGRRILMHLQEQKVAKVEITAPCVLVAEEVVVSQFSKIPLEYLVGIVSTKGSASSHVAILSNALGVPCVMGIENLPVNRIKGQTVLVDGYRGQIYVKPTKLILKEYKRLIHAEEKLDVKLKDLIDKPSETLDGVHIPLYANTGLLADISPSLKSGAEGVGLYRTEIPFLVRDGFPSEKEQLQIYKEVLQGFSPRTVTFRTLDIGGDKALPYFPIAEENPFLGWRGIRIMLDHPEIFLTQIRAILKANIYGDNLRLMLPMISDVGEVDAALKLIQQVHKELIEADIIVPYPAIGVMIEVPSAVYQIEALAKRVDFFSIGSNDLTQYLLAVDRNNKQVAPLYNCLHPSVLQAIQHVVETAHKFNKTVSVCGEMAGDPVSALALIGLGVDSLSMSVGSLLKVKWLVRTFTQQYASQLVKEVLIMEKASDIRKKISEVIDKAGLGAILTSGK